MAVQPAARRWIGYSKGAAPWASSSAGVVRLVKRPTA
jgi:hypothetical protein